MGSSDRDKQHQFLVCVVWFLFGVMGIQTAEGRTAVWPPDNGLATPKVALRLSGFHSTGFLPAFTASERAISGGEIELSGWPDSRLYVNVCSDYRLERTAIGASNAGPGSLRLMTMATPRAGRVDVQLGWMAALPWSRDHGAILTDELDVWLLSGLSGDVGPARLGLTGGLAILGNPLRFANQDDAPLLWLSAAAPLGPVTATSRIGGALATARNPARLSSDLALSIGNPWRVGIRGELGLSPAAADLGGGVWVGHRWGLQDASL